MTIARDAAPLASGPPARVFLNYARADGEIADWLRDALGRAGADVWMDRVEIRGGERWQTEIDRELWRRQFVVCVVTGNSVRPERRWVHYEQERAEVLLKDMIPCVFEDPERATNLLPDRLKPLNAVFFVPDREVALRELVDAIRGKLHGRGDRRFPKVPLLDQSGPIKQGFVGREGDLRSLKRLIDEDSRQATGRKTIGIVGMGGLGKTVLAEELARRLAFHYPGGVLVESRGGKNPQEAPAVLDRWVEWVQGEPPRQTYLPQDVASMLKGFGDMLVVLDDVSDAGLDDTQTLLAALPVDSTRVVTTRLHGVLDALGAIHYPLDPLLEGDAILLLRNRLWDKFGVQLEREGLSFSTEIERYAEPLKTLTSLVDRHPLALDLGIGTCHRLADVPVAIERLRQSLEHGVRRFKRDVRAAADRNTSLAACLEHSLKDLEGQDVENGTDWVRRYRALGVFPDGSYLSASLLKAVWGDSDDDAEAADAIAGLVGRAILRCDRDDLYVLHPVVRAYATGLLNEQRNDADRVRARYERWIIDRAATVYARPQEEWSGHWLLVNHLHHVGARLASAVEKDVGRLEAVAGPEPPADAALAALEKLDRGLVDLGLAYAEALKEYAIRRPEWGHVLQSLQLGLACARAASEAASQAEFLKRLGGATSRSDPKLAQRYFAAALELARTISDERQIASILTFSGELERTQSRWESALQLLEQGLAMHRQGGDSRMEAVTLKYIGEVYWRRGKFAAALERYHRAQEICQRDGNVAGQADLLNKIGSVEFNRGNHRGAIEWFKQALELHEKVGNRTMQAEDKNDMGAAYRYLGEKRLALGLCEQALDIDVALGNRRHEAIVRTNRAALLGDLGELDESLREAVTAGHIAEEVGDPTPRGWALCWAGNALRGLGRVEEAEARYREAIAICREVENPRDLAGSLGMLAALLAAEPGRRAEARELFAEALAVMEKPPGLDQALGGRRLADLRAELARLGDE